MKKIILFTFLILISFAASAQLAQNTSESPSSRYNQTKLTVYPNPATEYFQLNDKNQNVFTINVYNIVGKKIKSFNVEMGKKYYLDSFPKGMYLVQFVGYDNKIISTQRLHIRKP